jgi:hypothetical protein
MALAIVLMPLTSRSIGSPPPLWVCPSMCTQGNRLSLSLALHLLVTRLLRLKFRNDIALVPECHARASDGILARGGILLNIKSWQQQGVAARGQQQGFARIGMSRGWQQQGVEAARVAAPRAGISKWW